jgi:lysophospholipase L1-like esterase
MKPRGEMTRPALATAGRARARWGLAALATLVGLLAGEAALRVLGVSHPAFGRPDPDLGWGYVPGAEGRADDEGQAWVRINRLGYRDIDHSPSKPPGTFRVALLGDSFTAAFEVPFEESWGALLQQELSACPQLHGRSVETLNFGVSGYGTAQELLCLRRDVWQFSPDLVVVAFCAGNDLRDNTRALSGPKARPWFTLESGPVDSLVLDDSFARATAYALNASAPARLLRAAVSHSRLLQTAREVKNRLRAQVRHARARAREGTPTGEAALATELGTDIWIYAPPRQEAWQEAWRITERLLRAIASEVRGHGASLLVVTTTSGAQVAPDLRARAAFLSRLRQTLAASDLLYAERRLAAFGERERIAVLPLAPLFQERSERDGTVLHGFARSGTLGAGHWNQAGHRLAAEVVAHWICAFQSPRTIAR